jgi:hypothetical protein
MHILQTELINYTSNLKMTNLRARLEGAPAPALEIWVLRKQIGSGSFNHELEILNICTVSESKYFKLDFLYQFVF